MCGCLFPRAPELCGSCFAGGWHLGVECTARSAPALVHHTPHSFAHFGNLLLGESPIGDEIRTDTRRILGDGLAALIRDPVNQAGVVNRAAISDSGGDHGHLER